MQTFPLMNKTFYAVKLVPPRPDFAMTMTEDEKAIMGQHMQYWQTYMNKGMVHVFGPVFDPHGVYGFGVLSAATEEEIKEFLNNDPSLSINKVEYYPMMAVLPES